MNGSSQLEEADNKPFALCPVCLRKMSSYLGFNGEELDLFRELRDVFKLMNHKDQLQCFKREIELFNNIIARLSEVYSEQHSASNVNSDNEGGNFEQRKNELKVGLNKDKFEQMSSTSSDVTYKTVSTIKGGQQVSIT
jgi:hypothetical protein